jgi:soluble lytic murein transglycosylase-like protein
MAGEDRLLEWMKDRRPDAFDGSSAIRDAGCAAVVPLRSLPRDQAAVASWLSRKYRVGAAPVAALVAEAHALRMKNAPDPLLILAVMAIESNFNPFVQSPAGAKGLMQVVTDVHAARFDRFGGAACVFDPRINLRVGAEVLRDCIALKGGSVEDGLRFYFGGVNAEEETGYPARVLAERERLRQIAAGAVVPIR